MAVWSFSSVLVLGLVTSPWLCRGAVPVYVYEMYGMKPNTNRSVACGVCEARNGRLALRPELDDWEIQFGNWSRLQSTDFWVDLTKTTSGTWIWGDGVTLDLDVITSLPMTPPYNVTYATSNCALWNMAEPFYMPADCSVPANIICQVPAPAATPECELSELHGMAFDSTVTPSLNTITSGVTTLGDCKSECSTSSDCWAADWEEATKKCRTLVSSSRPAVPDLTSNSSYITIGRTCVKYVEMLPEESEFVCNCGAIDLPETEEEKQKFVEEYKEEVKKELIVPTETLSATVRKKESAPDERQSSTSIGFLGISMLVLVFGSLVLLDLTSLFAHCKNAADNLKKAFGEGEEGSSDA